MKTIFVVLSALVVFAYSLCMALVIAGRERWKYR